MADDLKSRLDESNAQFMSPQVPKPALPEEISKTPMPEVGGTKGVPERATVASDGGIKGRLEESNRSLVPKLEEAPIGIPEKKSLLSIGDESPIAQGLAGHLRRGAQATPILVQKMADIVGKALGLEKTPGESPAEKATKYLEPTPVQKTGMEELSKTLPGMIAGGVAEAPGAIVPYVLGGAIVTTLGIPALLGSILTMAGIGAIHRSDKGIEEVIKGLPEDVVIGGIFHYLGPAFKAIKPGEKGLAEGGMEVVRGGQTRLVKAGVMAAMFGGQALKDTGDIKEAISSGFVGALLGFTGGGKKEKGIHPKRLLPVSKQNDAEEKFIRGEPSPGYDESDAGFIPNTDMHDVTERVIRWGPDTADLEMPEHIDVGAVLQDYFNHSERELGDGHRLVDEMRMNPVEGEMVLKTPNGNTVKVKQVKNIGLVATAAEDANGKKLDLNPQDMNGDQFKKLFGLPDLTTYSEKSVEKIKIIPDKIEAIDTRVPVRKDVMKPEPKGEPSRGPSSPRTSAPFGEGLIPNVKLIEDLSKRLSDPKVAGFTIDKNGNDVTTGYSVGQGGAVITNGSPASLEDHYLKDYKRYEGLNKGGWVDPDTKQGELEPSKNFVKLTEAVKDGIKKDQKTIWDHAKKEDIRLKDKDGNKIFGLDKNGKITMESPVKGADFVAIQDGEPTLDFPPLFMFNDSISGSTFTVRDLKELRTALDAKRDLFLTPGTDIIYKGELGYKINERVTGETDKWTIYNPAEPGRLIEATADEIKTPESIGEIKKLRATPTWLDVLTGKREPEPEERPSFERFLSLQKRKAMETKTERKTPTWLDVLTGKRPEEREPRSTWKEFLSKNYPEKKPEEVTLRSFTKRFTPEGFGEGVHSGSERVYYENNKPYFKDGWLAKRWYAYGEGQQVEPRFQSFGEPTTIKENLKIFDQAKATPEEMQAFNAMKEELNKKFAKEFGFNRNMPQEAMELDYAAAKELGYDGLNQGEHIGVFTDLSTKIKARGVFYHLSEKIIEDKMSGKMPSTQISNMLKNSGVKPEEMRWNGLDDFLKQPKSYTKQEVLDYLKKNRVEVREILKTEGAITPEAPEVRYNPETLHYEEIGGTKFSQWQLPGGENYRELLLQLPTESYKIGMEPPFRGAHWGEPNVLAHVRFNDRVDAQGKRVLFIEEVQSDWHQAGRERGYSGKLSPEELSRKQQLNIKSTVGKITPDEQIELDGLNARHDFNAPPEAPFSKTWHEMAMRRMVRWAAENGYDKVAWTTGEQQAARYDLSKQLNEISYLKNNDGTFTLDVIDKNGTMVNRGIGLPDKINSTDLEKYIGKDVASKIINGEGTKTGTGDRIGKKLSGLDLKVGGEGMKGFYDKIIPEYMNKFGKKWGAKVGETEISSGAKSWDTKEWIVYDSHGDVASMFSDKKAAEALVASNPSELSLEHKEPIPFEYKVHSLDITPSMKESVVQEGVPLFRAGVGVERGTEKLSPKLIKGFIDIVRSLGGEEINVEAREHIARDEEQIGTLMRDHGMTRTEAEGALVFGQYSRNSLGALVELGKDAISGAKNIPTEGRKTAIHETLHFLEDVKLMRSEKDALNKWMPNEEKRIEKLTDIIHNDLYGGAKSMLPESIRKIVVKLENFIKDFGRFLAGKGYGTEGVDKIIRDIESGEIGKRRIRETPLPEAPRGPVPLELDTARDHIIRARTAKEAKEEVKDDIRAASTSIKGGWDGLKRLFMPGARGISAERTAVIAGKELASMERSHDVFDKAMEKAEKAFDKMPIEEQYAFSQAASSGEQQATPELSELRKQFKEISDAKAKEINSLDEDGLMKVRENYWPGADNAAYKAKQGVDQKALPPTRIFEPTGFMKPKDFQEFNDMLAAGYVPTESNPVKQFRQKMLEWDKFIYTHKMVQQLELSGDAVKIGSGEQVPPGWKAIPPPYGVTKTGRYVMTDQAAQVFENWLSRPIASSKYFGDMYRSYMTASTALQRFQLFGFFHGGFVTAESIVSRGALAIKQGFRVLTGQEDLGTFLRTAASVPLAPYQKYKMGREIYKEWATPGTSTDPRVLQAVEDIVSGGGGVSQEKMFTSYWIESMKKDFKEGRRIMGVIRSPFAGMEMIMKPLMQAYVPRLKLGAFEELSTELRKAKPGLSDVQYNAEMRQIWNRIDDRLGQVRWQRIFMNNTAKNLTQMLIRAPGWTGGTIMEIGVAPKDAFNFVKEWAKTGKAPTTLPDRVAYVLSLAATTMVANAALTCILANKKPEELTPEDYMAFQTGDIDERGKPMRGMLPLYSKDVYAYRRAPVSTIWHKMNPIIGLIYELSQNKDYYGTGIVDPTKGEGEKIGEIGMFLAKAFLPFGYRGMTKVEEERGITPEGVIGPALGVMPAPTYFSQTKAMQKALELGAMKMPTAGRTQEEYERNRLLNTHIKKYMSAASKGQPVEEALAGLQKDVESGKLKMQDVMKFKTKLKHESLETSVSRLSIDKALVVFKVANDEEKRKLIPIIFKKYRNLRDATDKQQYALEIEKISNELSRMYNLGGE